MKEDNKKYFDLKKLAEKIYNNSVWLVYSPNVFYFYDSKTADEITKIGKEYIRKSLI